MKLCFFLFFSFLRQVSTVFLYFITLYAYFRALRNNSNGSKTLKSFEYIIRRLLKNRRRNLRNIKYIYICIFESMKFKFENFDPDLGIW